MELHWLYSDKAGVACEGPEVAFADRESAEQWLSDHFAELVEDGIDEVTLMEGAEPVYGPMSLHPPDPDADGPDDAIIS